MQPDKSLAGDSTYTLAYTWTKALSQVGGTVAPRNGEFAGPAGPSGKADGTHTARSEIQAGRVRLLRVQLGALTHIMTLSLRLQPFLL